MTDTPTPKTRGQEAAADVGALLRARNPLIWITTREEARAERLLFEAAASAGYAALAWDCAQGVTDLEGRVQTIGTPDPDGQLAYIRERSQAQGTANTRTAWIMRDLPGWLDGPAGLRTVRILRNLARSLPMVKRDTAQAIIVLSASSTVPESLAGHATVIDWPLPDRAEIAAIIDAALAGVRGLPSIAEPTPEQRDAAIDAAVGLTGEEAASCYARSLVKLRTIDPVTVAGEKKRVISREGLLEWVEPIAGGLDAVGGLENLKAWLAQRANAYTPAARAYGVRKPKGILIVGVSGTGKSLCAKAVPTAWGIPCIRMDLGALKSKFMGESEGNLRKAFKTIAALGRCVLWLDEIEKATAGATTAQGGDGGVAQDQIGALLTWMQERDSDAFLIATANSIEDLPPEFLRKGRWDEVWFVDIPNAIERVAVLQATLRAEGRTETIDLQEVAAKCRTFTGAEIAAIVPDAVLAAFNDNARPITTADLIAAAANVVPIAKTAGDKITKLRAWAEGKARFASTPLSAAETESLTRQIDL